MLASTGCRHGSQELILQTDEARRIDLCQASPRGVDDTLIAACDAWPIRPIGEGVPEALLPMTSFGIQAELLIFE